MYSETRQVVLNKDVLAKNRCIAMSPGSPFLGPYKVLRTQIYKRTQAEGWNTLMVTSAVPGEGKTYTAINLAMSIAMELQRTVLLVDADVVQPSIAARLGLNLGPGLIDLLENSHTDLSTYLVKTSIPDLSVLGAGRRHGRSTELLASAAMARLVDDLANRYPDRVVLFDSPPMLATSESSVLARHMGQIVLTVEAGATPRSAISRVVRMLDACDIVIPVLNKASGMPGMNYALGYYLDGKYGKQ